MTSLRRKIAEIEVEADTLFMEHQRADKAGNEELARKKLFESVQANARAGRLRAELARQGVPGA